MKPSLKNIVVLISGAGSNMLAVANAAQKEQWFDRFGAQIACVISSRPDAEGLAAAKALGITTRTVDHKAFTTRAAFDTTLSSVVDEYQPAVVVLAGFMRILTPAFVNHYAQRLVNIHPSLLPAFTGLDTHQRAIDAGCKVAGATVHFVTPTLDQGLILAQAVVPVMHGDTAAALSARVLSQEHLLLPRALRALLKDLTQAADEN